MKTLKRMIRHLRTSSHRIDDLLPKSSMTAITLAIRTQEMTQTGEIIFAVEHALSLDQLKKKMTPRQRAESLFSSLRVWDTEGNNGVLIYLLIADQAFEIVADREAARRVPKEAWSSIQSSMVTAFKAGEFESGILDGIKALGLEMNKVFQGHDLAGNELPDRPTRIQPPSL
ncbi:MAG: hypothetical protein EBT06_08670 [Gammaproteobacteria bacterium]|jgi:uncharacterized membrane protein|nr:hypothetical protein [Gammaproteobacteria bacterium]NBT44982.1 hypothetical protein [Gammaproteobacteria bacterium]NBY23932.1 hypothetical protein [Gammaproteobacteria bacterium]